MSDPPPDAVSIVFKARGPYVVRGEVRIEDEEGTPITPPPAKTPGVVKLCGCGHSATRPFCDGTHKSCPPGMPPRG